ncbi:thyroid receptor-interacting protein 11 [Bombyx mori]|uniref:GRIP domain-containing protein n=2 Tax=Bombyx mori TaxID=7091 RepID=A0A8R2M897_BOMMO|nr:thyroid receptor-interacting protein 11 isoform X1 [Bombyx mori]
MSWLNLNQSLNSLKGQITNFASEVLSEGPGQDVADEASRTDNKVIELEEKCRLQEQEIVSLKKLSEELQGLLQSERHYRKNGIKEDETSWYWDPPAETSKSNPNLENQYKHQIQTLQDEISSLKERATVDLKPDNEEELNRLREENKNLTVNLEDLDNQHQMAMERLLTLKKELQKNFEVLKQEHEELKTSNDDYAVEVKTLLEKIGERDKEIENLKVKSADSETLSHKYQNLERIHSLLRENAEKFQEENQELHEEVFKLQEQVTKLEHEIELAIKKTEKSNTVPKEQYDEVIKELNELKNRKNLDLQLDEINIDDNAKSVIENLKREIGELKHQLNQRSSGNHETEEHKTIKAEKFMQLYNKYVNFELPIDYVGEIPSPGDSIVLYKLESVLKTVNSFKRDIDTLEQKLSEKNLNINHLKTQIDDLTAENDFLTTDIQHYESELNEMKKNNDFLISEIAVLKNTSKLEPIIETHEDNLAKLETELADSNKLNKSFECEIKRIEKELAEVQAEKFVLQETLNDLKGKYTAMLNEVETLQNKTRDVEELENSACVQQTEQLKAASDEIDNLKKLLNAANAKSEQLSIDVHIIENDKVLLMKEIDELKKDLRRNISENTQSETNETLLKKALSDNESKLEELSRNFAKVEQSQLQGVELVGFLKEQLQLKDNHVPRTEFDKLNEESNTLTGHLEQAIKEKTSLSKTIETLKQEIELLKQNESELLTKNDNKKDQDLNTLKLTMEDLKAKLIQQELMDIEVESLKVENKKLNERRIQLETELSNTDSKIVHLEEEFEKLVTDLNDKDTLIDTLNNTVAQNAISLANLSQNVTDLENTLSKKNEEIQSLKNSLEDATVKRNRFDENVKELQAEISKLNLEKEEISKQIMILHDEVNVKNAQISTLTNHLGELENSGRDYKISIENKDKEIKELNQSIVELTDKIKTVDNSTHHNDEYATLLSEKTALEKQVIELKNNVSAKETELIDLKVEYDQIEKSVNDYKITVDKINSEKGELINLVNLKHNESIQYHNEIQRLNQVLMEHTNEYRRLLEEKDHLIQNVSQNCANCENLKIILKEKDDAIVKLNQATSESLKMRAELDNAGETVNNLTEKCDNLNKNLTIQLEVVKKLTAENLQLSEKEQNLARELDRLRLHLVETEESYTQELMVSEQKLTECQTRLHQVEERAKQTSTVYTSNSIRANQEVETLRNQIKLLEKQREEVQGRLSEAEDARSRSEAALTNLQVVLEQFQLDKERDVHAATEKIRNKMEELKHRNNDLQDEIARLNAKVQEALAGLQAASRLGDQVETKTAQINDLKEQVATLQASVTAAEERYYNAISNQQDKVDKNLVKNMVINYVLTQSNNTVNKIQVLRVLSTILDFNQQECEKLGLVKTNSATDSLAAEFVKFLQNESKPRSPLPNMMGIAQSSRSTTPTSRKSSTIGPHPTFETGHKRNPSNGSNNLLFQNLDALETASVISRDSEPEPRAAPSLDTGVNQTRNTEGSILKYVLKDM